MASKTGKTLKKRSIKKSSVKGTKKVDPLKAWRDFVKKVATEEKINYSQAIKRAKIRKDKGEKWKGGMGESDSEPILSEDKSEVESDKSEVSEKESMEDMKESEEMSDKDESEKEEEEEEKEEEEEEEESEPVESSKDDMEEKTESSLPEYIDGGKKRRGGKKMRTNKKMGGKRRGKGTKNNKSKKSRR